MAYLAEKPHDLGVVAKDILDFQCFLTHALESEILAGIRTKLD